MNYILKYLYNGEIFKCNIEYSTYVVTIDFDSIISLSYSHCALKNDKKYEKINEILYRYDSKKYIIDLWGSYFNIHSDSVPKINTYIDFMNYKTVYHNFHNNQCEIDIRAYGSMRKIYFDNVISYFYQNDTYNLLYGFVDEYDIDMYHENIYVSDKQFVPNENKNTKSYIIYTWDSFYGVLSDTPPIIKEA